MICFRAVLSSALGIAVLSSSGIAQELGKYRDFQFGMTAEAVAKQVQMKTSEVRTSHNRPALIQSLQWDQAGFFEKAAKTGSVRGIRFDFYNDELSKMVVIYNPDGTEGLTADDLIDAISTVYGTAAKPQDSVSVSHSTSYEDREKVLARWEDAQYSYNLFHSSYSNTFGLVAFSKKLELMSGNASREADRLDKVEAPAKELARQQKQADDTRTSQEAARSVNKPRFLP